MRKYKESNDILNTSDYFLFDGEEEIKEEKTDSFNKHQSKDNSGIEFFNPKTQILKKTNIDKFNFNSKNSNELMNSFELLGNLDTNRNNNLNNPKNENINNNIVSKSSFEYISIIGKGGFGKVWKVFSRKKKIYYALKEMSKTKIIDKRSEKSVKYERDLLSTMNHP